MANPNPVPVSNPNFGNHPSAIAQRQRGRPRGQTEATRFAKEVINSEEYKESVWRRLKNDTLPPAVEVKIMEYAWGKPKERIEISLPGQETFDQLHELPTAELLDRYSRLASVLTELREAEDALTAEIVSSEVIPTPAREPAA